MNSKHVLVLGIVILMVVLTNGQGTLFSVSSNFTVSYAVTHGQLAHIYYNQKLNEHGTNYIDVYGNGEKTLLEQHRGAGFLEGYTTYRQIYGAYRNLNRFKLGDAPTVPLGLQDFLNTQLEYIQRMIDAHPRDLYWQYVQAYLEQCRYAYRGFLQRIHEDSRLDMYIGFSQFYYLTSVGDFRQLLPAFQHTPVDQRDKSCSIYIKLLQQKLYVSHSTINYYAYMLRIFKNYHFPTRNSAVGSQSITFSSRPADFNSKDDFYLLSSGLKVMETSLINYRPENLKELNAHSVPCWLRAIVASNLARTGQEWIDYFIKENSGTHNNQWVLVDPFQLPSSKKVVVFVQQAFSLIKITDVTPLLLKNGYVASYNVPYDLDISRKLGDEFYPFDYDNDPRASIFRKYHPKMIDEQSMKQWLITNQETDVREGIAPREDLYEPSPSAYGIIDCKIFTPNTQKQNYYWAISSPSLSNGRFPPFDWSKFPKLLHQSMPTVYNFTWQKVSLDVEKSMISEVEDRALIA